MCNPFDIDSNRLHRPPNRVTAQTLTPPIACDECDRCGNLLWCLYWHLDTIGRPLWLVFEVVNLLHEVPRPARVLIRIRPTIWIHPLQYGCHPKMRNLHRVWRQWHRRNVSTKWQTGNRVDAFHLTKSLQMSTNFEKESMKLASQITSYLTSNKFVLIELTWYFASSQAQHSSDGSECTGAPSQMIFVNWSVSACHDCDFS